jgi:thiamine-monophosphate kinase
MAADELQLIERLLHAGARRDDVRLGIGDDAAVLVPPAGHELVLTTDALVEGAHFLSGAPPRSLGHRALAVNLSDVAAMGAAPAWALLSLVLPQADTAWLEEFALGFGALARAHGVALVGGNLARGPLSITVQLAGLIPAGSALRRSGAGSGDLLYVSGTLGDAAASHAVHGGTLAASAADAAFLRQRFEYPTPRVGLGRALAGLASACIDVSDGLYADLGRLLAASGCGARVQVDRLPLSPALERSAGTGAWRQALAGGEDYELCFTVPPQRLAALEAALAAMGADARRATAPRPDAPVHCIGELRPDRGIELNAGGVVMQFSHAGYDHFAA